MELLQRCASFGHEVIPSWAGKHLALVLGLGKAFRYVQKLILRVLRTLIYGGQRAQTP